MEMLPPLPPGYHHVAMFGVLVSLPVEWNVHVYRGDFSKGMMMFADLRQPTMEVRWRKRGKGEAAREVELEPTPTGIATHVADGGRMYELHWPRHAADPVAMRQIAETFRGNLAVGGAGSDPVLWAVYGIKGWVPRAYRLVSSSLLPGAPQLTFRGPGWFGGGVTLTVAAISRAEQVRENLSLRAFAVSSLPWLREYRQQAWTEAGDEATVTAETGPPVPLLRKRLRLTLRHDREANVIRWERRIARRLAASDNGTEP